MLLNVSAPPERLSSTVDPEIIRLPEPTAVALLTFNVPAETVSPPINVFAPESVNAPLPAFVSEYAPLMTPPSVNVPALTVTVRFAPKVTAPVPKFKELVPLNVKSPLQVCAMLLANVNAAPERLSSTVAPAIVRLPVLNAFELLRFNVPAESVSPPLNVFAPDSVSTPPPSLVKEYAPLTTPPTVNVPALTVNVRLALNVTVPVPRFKSLLPLKTKSPLHVCALLLLNVKADPLVLSSDPPEIVTAEAAAPKALELLIFNVPAESVNPPLNVFAPESVNAPLPAFVSE